MERPASLFRITFAAITLLTLRFHSKPLGLVCELHVIFTIGWIDRRFVRRYSRCGGGLYWTKAENKGIARD